MLTDKLLKTEYQNRKGIIKKRLKEFSIGSKSKDAKEKFLELCFCLCTPQSNAKRVANVIHSDNMDKLITCDWEELSGMLRTNARFHNNKARYIIEARKYMPDINKLSKDTIIAREFLVKNIKGLGYKEASHFLRNIGYRDICIIDRHVITLMHELNVFKNNNPPKNPKEYLAMEHKVKDYAKMVNINVDELDLLLWSIKTGFVFK